MENATENITKLDSLIKESSTIMVICHTGADPDAISSLIAMQSILKTHYKKTNVIAVGERIPAGLNFIPGYYDVINGSILEHLEKNGVDLLIALDFSQMHLASKTDSQQIDDYIQKAGIPFVVIDHHPAEYKNEKADLYINVDPTSTASNLHIIFHRELQVPIVPKVADLLLYGIIGDTNRFKYKYGAVSQTTILKIATELLDVSTMSIEQISNSMERFDLKTLPIIAIFMRNTKLLNENFAYTTISEDEMVAEGCETTKLGDSASYVTNILISMVNTAQRGVVIYPHLLEENTYTVRFRSCNEAFPINEFATALGGGGHAQSAAARVKAPSIVEALEKVISVIENK